MHLPTEDWTGLDRLDWNRPDTNGPDAIKVEKNHTVMMKVAGLEILVAPEIIDNGIRTLEFGIGLRILVFFFHQTF